MPNIGWVKQKNVCASFRAEIALAIEYWKFGVGIKLQWLCDTTPRFAIRLLLGTRQLVILI